MFRDTVKGTGYPLHSPVSPSTSPPVRHRVPSHFNWTLPKFRKKMHSPSKGLKMGVVAFPYRILTSRFSQQLIFRVCSLEMLHVIIRVIVVLACDAMPTDLREKLHTIMFHMTSELPVFCNVIVALCQLQINSCHEQQHCCHQITVTMQGC
jgi:hypothetical protein